MTLSTRTPELHVVIPTTMLDTNLNYCEYSDNTLSQCTTEADLEGPPPPHPLLEEERYVTKHKDFKPSTRTPPRKVWYEISRWVKKALIPLTQTELEVVRS